MHTSPRHPRARMRAGRCNLWPGAMQGQCVAPRGVATVHEAVELPAQELALERVRVLSPWVASGGGGEAL